MDNKELYINIEKYLLKKHHNNPKLLNTSTLNNNWINDRNLDLKNKHKQKMSNIASNRVGEKNPFYNKTHTEETKEKISKAKMGKPNLHDSQKCVIDGRLYDSLTQASKLLDIPIATISTRIRSKNKLFVNWYKLKTHNVVEVLDDRVLDIDSKNITCLFSINNKFYYNIDSICGDFGISKNTITNRCNSKKEEFKYWFKLI